MVDSGGIKVGMRRLAEVGGRRSEQSGYALVLMLFFLAVLTVSLAAASGTVYSTIEREKEAELIWRGEQYTRGIKLYYLKLHRFPTSLDDLTKPKTGIRFMRQAYKDPMNAVDGSWRLIYVGPNGQIIGSLNNSGRDLSALVAGTSSSAFQFAGTSVSGAADELGVTNAPASSFNSSAFGTSSTAGRSQTGAFGTAQANGASSSAFGTSGDSTTGGDSTTDGSGQPHSLVGEADSSNTIGGNIIGVGSKVDKNSFMVYKKAKNYKKFEFIWEQLTTMSGMRPGAPGIIGGPGQNPGGSSSFGTPGTNSTFSSPGTFSGPSQNPGQNQNPSQNLNPSSNPDPNQSPLP